MTPKEFSEGFDTLVSSYRRFKDYDKKENLDSVEFDEYEKSYYLTKAQEELVTSLYSGRNATGESFESTEEQRRYLSNLVRETNPPLEPISNSTGLLLGIGSTSKFFTLPEDLWYITYEAVNLSDASCSAYSPMDVYPVTQDDYNKTKRNPFRGPNDRRALRLDLSDGVVEIISKYTVSSYYVRYLKKPHPIVLEDMPNNLTVEGEGKESGCELHEALHQRILEIAVGEALQSKLGSTTKDNNK